MESVYSVSFCICQWRGPAEGRLQRAAASEALVAFINFHLFLADKAIYETVLKKWEQFCMPHKNEKYERCPLKWSVERRPSSRRVWG